MTLLEERLADLRRETRALVEADNRVMAASVYDHAEFSVARQERERVAFRVVLAENNLSAVEKMFGATGGAK